MKNVKLTENYYLITHELKTDAQIIEAPKSVNHLVIIDVSGSMYNDLPEIRRNLKNKISNMVKPEDTISIIWFSGNNQAGVLKEAVKVSSLTQLNDLNEAIDRWLKPIGLTAFAKPLELASEIIERIRLKDSESTFSLVFMSDGWNNSCSWDSVINTLNKIAPNLAFSTIVEYGFYADSSKLTEMSGILGGEKISCDGFEDYDVVLNQSLSKNIKGGKKIVVEISENYLHDFAFSVTDGSVLLYNVVDGKILVGSDVKEIHFFSPKAIGIEIPRDLKINVPSTSNTALYAAIYVLSDKLLNDDAEKVFYALGDQYYYAMLANAFGKQKLNAFKTAIKDCVTDTSKRFPDGQSTIQKVPDDAYCLMNLIEDLGSTEGCLFYPNHSDFVYNRIGRKKISAATVLTETEKKRISEAKNLDEINDITKELAKNKVDIKFVNSNPNRGYFLTDLVWNESRANLSVRIYIEGEAVLPENKFKIDKVASFKYNTFTLVKDGIVNVHKLPVSYSDELRNLLSQNGVEFKLQGSVIPPNGLGDMRLVIDLTSLPIVNKKMVKAVSAMELAKQQWELKKLQGDKKVYDYYKKQLFPKTSKSFVELLGQEASDWLKEVGVTDYNGFAPKVMSVEAIDFYMSVVLNTKIKGLSSLPKVEDVMKKIESGAVLKLNEYVMADAIKKYQAQLVSDIYLSLGVEQQKGVLKTYLETKSGILNKQRRKVLQEIAQIKFSLILSKKWFTEFKSFDENQLAVNFDGQDLNFTFALGEKEEKI